MQDPTRSESDLMEDVRVAAASLTAPWTLEQLATTVGTRPEALHGCVDRLIEGGTVEDLGEDPRHEGDGPAPRLYGPRPLDESPEDKDVKLD